MFKKTILPNGLKVLTVSMPDLPSVSISVFIGVGSRYETFEQNGISHFLEHMLFKGTEKRPTRQDLMQDIEKIGGLTNAQTRKEFTSCFIKVPKHHFKEGLEIIVDMVFHSKIDPELVEKEKEAVIAQINRRLDTPKERLFDLLRETCWIDKPLGRCGLGTKETIKNLTRDKLLDHYQKFFVPENIILLIVGNIQHNQVLRATKKLMDKSSIPREKPPGYLPIEESQKTSQLSLEFRKMKQVHLMLGVKTFSYSCVDERFTLEVLSSLLGVGFGSRLYLNLREKEKLLFSPRSWVIFYSDTGLLVIQAETTADKVKSAIVAILKELTKFKNHPLEIGELKTAKEKQKAKFLFNLESPERLTEWYGFQEILHREVLLPNEVLAKIDRVTAEDIQQVAQRLFVNSNLNLALIGPIKNKKEIGKILYFDRD